MFSFATSGIVGSIIHQRREHGARRSRLIASLGDEKRQRNPSRLLTQDLEVDHSFWRGSVVDEALVPARVEAGDRVELEREELLVEAQPLLVLVDARALVLDVLEEGVDAVPGQLLGGAAHADADPLDLHDEGVAGHPRAADRDVRPGLDQDVVHQRRLRDAIVCERKNEELIRNAGKRTPSFAMMMLVSADRVVKTSGGENDWVSGPEIP